MQTGQCSGNASLMLVIGIGMKQADGDRFDGILSAQPPQAPADGFAKRLQHSAVGSQTLFDSDTAGRVDDRRRALDLQITEVSAVLAADDEHILKACGRNKQGARTPALEKGIGADRGAVDNLKLRRQGQPGRVIGMGEEMQQPGQDGPDRVVGGGRNLMGYGGRTVQQKKIGEGAAGIDPEFHGNECSSLRAWKRLNVCRNRQKPRY